MPNFGGPGSGFTGGAASGAASGIPFGPIGIGIGAVGGALSSLFGGGGRRRREQEQRDFQLKLQQRGFANQQFLQQGQFAENLLGRNQQQGQFDFRATERRGIREGQLGEIDRLKGLFGTGGISQQDQDMLTQQNNLQVNRNVGGFANSLAQRFGGLNQPGIRAALFGNQLGQQQQFTQNLQRQSIGQVADADSQRRQLIASLFGGLRG